MQKAVIVGAIAVGLAAGSYGDRERGERRLGDGIVLGGTTTQPAQRSDPSRIRDDGGAGGSRGAASAATRRSSPATRPPR